MKHLAILLIAASLVSCKKDIDKEPEISFKTGGAYASSDVTIGKRDSVLVGITGKKYNDNDQLRYFAISRKLNSDAPVIIYHDNLEGGERKDFSYDYWIKPDTTLPAHTLRYDFDLSNDAGNYSRVSLNVKVQ